MDSAAHSSNLYRWLAAILPAVLLTPFINKAFHIDDTVFIYVAQHLHQNPFDFFGFEINWQDRPLGVFFFDKNPPGLSYFLALMALGLGWSEIALHSAQLIPTMLASVGLYQLGSRFSKSPLLVTTVAVLTPSFLVSTSVVMCEPLMLMFYVWSIVFWIKGIDKKSDKFLVWAGICIGLGALTKYVAVTAIPLLVAYTLFHERKVMPRSLAFFLIPVTMLAMYDLMGNVLGYGSLLKGVVIFEKNTPGIPFMQMLTTNLIHGLSFTGGCYITALFFLPVLHRWRMLLAMSLVFISVIPIALYAETSIRDGLVYKEGAIQWGFVLQLALYVTSGVYIFVLAAGDFYRTRDANSLLLLLLVGGIFVFSSFINWTINARSLFPMVIAVALLVVRQLEAAGYQGSLVKRAAIPLVLAAFVSLSVGYADFTYAGTAREMARRVHAEKRPRTQKVWFEGHWGFQYYMEQGGAAHMDWRFVRGDDVPKPAAGDTIVWWVAQYDGQFPPYIGMSNLELIEIPAASWVSIMSKDHGAGFYWSNKGPLPYRFGKAAPQKFWVFTVGTKPYERLETILKKIRKKNNL